MQLAPGVGRTLDASRERQHRLADARRKAVVNGELVVKRLSNARFHKAPSVAGLDVRSGVGLVHNTIKAAKAKV